MNQAVAKLIWVDDPRYEYPLVQASFVIGRDDACTLPLKGNNKASRRHAEVLWHQGQFWLRDLGSHNGTKLNGKKATQEALFDGDAIFLAGLRFRFVNPYAPAPPERAREQSEIWAGPKDEESTGTILQAPPTAAPKKDRTVALAGAVASVLFLCVLVYVVSFQGGGAESYPQAVKYGDLRIHVGERALVTIPYSNIKLKNTPEVIAVGRHQNENVAVSIVGKAAGAGALYACGEDKKTWYLVDIWVEPAAPWPPGWKDQDRNQEAKKAADEADQLRKDNLNEVSKRKAYFLYDKAFRLYSNCQNTDTEKDRVLTEMRSIQVDIDNSEYGPVRDFKTAWSSGDIPKAREAVAQLLRLFPADGDGADVMSSHGDPVKRRQYEMLDDFLKSQAQGGK